MRTRDQNRSVSRATALWRASGTRFAARSGGSERETEMEPTLRFELRTCCLRNSCSTAELCRPGFHAQLQLITGDSTDSG